MHASNAVCQLKCRAFHHRAVEHLRLAANRSGSIRRAGRDDGGRDDGGISLKGAYVRSGHPCRELGGRVLRDGGDRQSRICQRRRRRDGPRDAERADAVVDNIRPCGRLSEIHAAPCQLARGCIDSIVDLRHPGRNLIRVVINIPPLNGPGIDAALAVVELDVDSFHSIVLAGHEVEIVAFDGVARRAGGERLHGVGERGLDDADGTSGDAPPVGTALKVCERHVREHQHAACRDEAVRVRQVGVRHVVRRHAKRRQGRRRYANCGRDKRGPPVFQQLERHTLLLWLQATDPGKPSFPETCLYFSIFFVCRQVAILGNVRRDVALTLAHTDSSWWS